MSRCTCTLPKTKNPSTHRCGARLTRVEQRYPVGRSLSLATSSVFSPCVCVGAAGEVRTPFDSYRTPPCFALLLSYYDSFCSSQATRTQTRPSPPTELAHCHRKRCITVAPKSRVHAVRMRNRKMTREVTPEAPLTQRGSADRCPPCELRLALLDSLTTIPRPPLFRTATSSCFRGDESLR